MKKLAASVFLFSICLFAAEFWQSKPFSEWSDKDVQKLMTNSPWAKTVSISMGSGGGGGGGQRRGGGGGGGGGGAGAGGVGAGDSAMNGQVGGGGGGGTRAGGGGGDEMGGGGGGAPQIELFVRWRSALPLKQGIARSKYGAEAATSPEAKKFLDTEDKDYVIEVAGAPAGRGGGDPDAIKNALKGSATLNIKGKDPIHPEDVQISTQNRRLNAFFLFPKTNPIVEDDKEIEFECKVGETTVKSKFKLKDMTINGKLAI